MNSQRPPGRIWPEVFGNSLVAFLLVLSVILAPSGAHRALGHPASTLQGGPGLGREPAVQGYQGSATGRQATGSVGADGVQATCATLKADRPVSADLPDACIVRTVLPEVIYPQPVYTGTITMRNNGFVPWTSAGGFALVAVNDPSAVDAPIPLPAGHDVQPGQEYTFTIHLRAPLAAGYFDIRWRMDANGWQFGQAVAATIKAGAEPALYALERKASNAPGGVYTVGVALPLAPPLSTLDWSYVTSLGYSSEFPWNYLVLTESGHRACGGIGVCFGGSWTVFPQGPGPYRAVLMGPQGLYYYVLDSLGQLWYSNGAPGIAADDHQPKVQDESIVSAALTSNWQGIYYLDAYGRTYGRGSAPSFAPPTPVFDDPIARRIRLSPDGAGYYVMDVHGQIYPGGQAPALAAHYQAPPGDWARDFRLTQSGLGYYLLDKEGGIHTGGDAVTPTLNLPPSLAGQDIGCDLAVADSRVPANSLYTSTPRLVFMIEPAQSKSATFTLAAVEGSPSWEVADPLPGWLTVLPLEGSGTTPIRAQIDGSQVGGTGATTTIWFRATTPGVTSTEISVRVLVVDHVDSLVLPLVRR